MKKISILGSTGSIGVNTLDVIERNPDRFEVIALAACSNVDVIAEQARKFRPKLVSLFDTGKVGALRKKLQGLNIEVVEGQQGSIQAATLPEADMVVSGMVGCAGLVPTYSALKAGKALALANKETLVVAGKLMMEAAEVHGCPIVPVDSEHSAIFQALNGEKSDRIKRIILTASGGPFRTFTCEQLEHVTREQALKHPNWDMGAKITIDSSTMMNKGLEYIEAKWLFGLETQVDILVHAQSIIHSLIEFVDTSVMAQLGMPDMRVPISYALSYPDRIECDLPSLDLAQLGTLTFEAPDFQRFPCLQLAHDALDIAQTMPAVLNAANEIAVQAFLDELIPFKDIPEIIRMALNNHKPTAVNDIEDVLEADRWAREETRKLVTVTH
ncbi:1-deoxy-D-xylulose-5-phosphate reductoisomerase [Nitrospina gracilis 3/211]|uniref:1-deoxy-D-xylulose 5-phosphate reductoisomerase n=1 Tax=Nitrospina gracilis (strain 3/211) TaxID=1266370 RepID=M1YWP6_NITG3|nr:MULTISPECIES: 1-deoxy-D-xylulose-5-phosphate reductoisomerase [Nitrospina]MCF8723057.1 1-deoxy-D-xylulose-5-phosphate reductoisomerase [Nitrospina sp. Nb-3]CCQ90091.1 1-deoxy-D-xylulose-5-phosphate reductoisomerase [Nitrospina gracilis 3/211]